jgi:hypothetical protein
MTCILRGVIRSTERITNDTALSLRITGTFHGHVFGTPFQLGILWVLNPREDIKL